MRKKLTLFLVCILAVFGVFFGVNFSVKAEASINNPEITNTTRANYDMDEALFRVLQALTKQINYNQNVTGFDTDLFTYGYKNYTANQNWDMTAEPYKTWQANRDAIVADLDKGEIDLTVGENAKYLCLQNTKLEPISDLTGLNNMAMETIKTLSINDANLSYVRDTDFENLSSLTTLNMKNCGLNSFELNPALNKINSLNLSGNNLTQINLATLVTGSAVDLSNNKISSLQDITFGTLPLSKLNLNFNLIYNFTDEDYQTLVSKMSNSQNLFVGIQSKNSFDELIAGDKILVTNYQNVFVSQLNVVAGYYAGSINSLKSAFYVDGQDNTICETIGEQTQEVLYAPAGKISFDFYSGDKIINSTNFPSMDTQILKTFANKYVKIALSSPSYTLKVNDEVVTDSYQQSDINIIFAVDQNLNIPNIQDVLSSDGAKIYSGTITNLSTQPQSELTVTNNGTFSICAKVEFDGISSTVTIIEVTRQNTTGIVWGVIIIVFLIILGAAVYYITRWIKEGAVVAPLNDKEIYSVKKRQERKYGRERQDNKKPLDASLRQNWREANKPQDEVLGSELNKQSSSFYNSNENSDYSTENYDDEYRKFAHSSFDDGYIDENLNEQDNINVDNDQEDVDADDEQYDIDVDSKQDDEEE